MNQYIKDAFDNETDVLGEKEKKETEKINLEKELANVKNGIEKLKELFEKSNWKSCQSTKKHHNRRRAIDRRFSGPKHLRTRDYSSDSEEGGGCSQQ